VLARAGGLALFSSKTNRMIAEWPRGEAVIFWAIPFTAISIFETDSCLGIEGEAFESAWVLL